MSRRVVLTGAGGLIGRTTATTVVALRIGYFALDRPDAAELVRAAVDAENVDFVVANGPSANRYRRADLQDTIRRLDYRPIDDAW